MEQDRQQESSQGPQKLSQDKVLLYLARVRHFSDQVNEDLIQMKMQWEYKV